ncbi:MAG: hypothetical protein KF893_01530 [Caldilineaceae bacterium]|nr:hypothetical protein [Caldilineaceae bacterium]
MSSMHSSHSLQPTLPTRTRRFLLAGVVLALLAALAMVALRQVQAAPDTGPDLTVELQVIPSVPNPGEASTVRMIFRNRGTAPSSPATFYFYVNPAQKPPTQATAPSYFSGVPSLPAGGSFQFERSVTFNTVGCDHIVYTWVDRDQQVTDVDRSNNLVGLQVCVGVQCEVDDFEDDDNSDKAGWINVSATQERSFCRDTNTGLTPKGDQDWVKFTAFAGLTYTLATTNSGLHAEPRIVLWSGGLSYTLAGPSASVVWQPPANGVYYAQIRNNFDEDEAKLGPLSRYDLRLSAVPAVTDSFEPDDVCGQAREIPTNGTHQTRLFQAPGDVDWIKFTIAAGETFALVADQTAQGVVPTITLFSSCVQSRSAENVAEGVRQVSAFSSSDQIYYARIANQDPNRFGADASYRLSVLAANCIPDAFEENDTLNQAKPLGLNQPQTHNICPAGDQDWVSLNLTAGQIYVIKTSNLGFAADTVLELYNAQGVKIAENDDYDYVKASRLFYQPTTSGVYYAMVRHHDPVAAGANTNYDLTLEVGFCIPDEADDATGDNGPADARTVPTNGTPVARNFCVNPSTRSQGDQSSLGDQDWMRFTAVAGARYHLYTDDLGPNADTIVSLYDRDGFTLLARSDDNGPGLSTAVIYTPTVAGDYFVQVTQYNSRLVGRETSYNLRIEENLPPPTPTPTPLPPTPTPTATPTPDPSGVRTLIVANRARMESIHGAGPTGLIMAKLFELADHTGVDGAVLQVEQDPAVAAAYAAWTASASTQMSNTLANNVASAIRNSILSFSAAAPDLAYLVIVGDDRVIPFRRVAEAKLSKNENAYATQLTTPNTIAAALAEDMILTDDFYADLEPSQWKGNELFVPDFAIGRLIQEPNEIIGQIDIFLGGGLIDTERALVTGYDFVQDSASLIRGLMVNDSEFEVFPPTYIGNIWPGSGAGGLRSTLLTASPAGSRFDMISINGHATHVSIGVPLGGDIRASEIMTATNSFVRSLVYNVGCHGGLNDSAVLDLPQAFVSKGAIYVGNTGFGWGGGGIVYSEALMRNFTREFLTERKAIIGPSLSAAKQSYVARARTFGGYDAKILMQTTLYGLPMFEITSGGTLSDDDPFTDVAPSISPPGSFSEEPNRGSFGYGLPQSFGAFSADDNDYRTNLKSTDSIFFEAGAPIQPSYYRDLSVPNAGSLRGVLFRGGVYTDTVAEAPIALALNEYITETTAPDFNTTGWYPSVPFAVQSSALNPSLRDTVALSLGQYDSATGTQRVFDRMSFDTYYSDSPDRSLAEIHHIDAVLDVVAGKGIFKVETTDASGVNRVVIAYTEGTGTWTSQDLLYDQAAVKWTGLITATTNTRYFVQVVDGAGNIAIDDNKGQYYPLLPPLPLAQGRALDNRLYLPAVTKGN